MKKDIRNLSVDELKQEMAAIGEPAHRARQVFRWLNRKNASSFTVMTDLPKKLIQKLDGMFTVGDLELKKRVRSKDDTEKFLWKLRDGELIESVLIKGKKRRTLCVSTQVGCKFKCPFCASGKRGLIRNLEVSEIIGQVLAAEKASGCSLTNIVFMGMGEPLDNCDNVMKSIRIINHPDGIGIGARKITVSTCGVVPGILRLSGIGLQVELSVSLHAANDALRDELVPINRRYPLEKLIKACEEYFAKTGRVITLEYTLIDGKNDSAGDAEELGRIAKKLKAKVNLIACNPVPESGTGKPAGKTVRVFQERLRRRGVNATLRRSRGDDIMAACGQLAAKRAQG
ncbi:MAG: 23S rRNA (adenine(2503)-C(2))-methyltransferase RlmN [Candidatus Omnitrophota bacterium]